MSDEDSIHDDKDDLSMDDKNEDVFSFENDDKEIIYSKNTNKKEAHIESEHETDEESAVMTMMEDELDLSTHKTKDVLEKTKSRSRRENAGTGVERLQVGNAGKYYTSKRKVQLLQTEGGSKLDKNTVDLRELLHQTVGIIFTQIEED